MLGQIQAILNAPPVLQDGLISARYSANVDGEIVDINQLLGSGISIEYEGLGLCANCDVLLSENAPGSYCFDCHSSLARCDLCIVSPNRCHLHLGTCREPDWADEFCMAGHVVYLSITSGPKIGITRARRVHQRWIDQGATKGLIVAKVASRRVAGYIEAHFQGFVSDRTDWRRMVRGQVTQIDLLQLAQQLQRRTPQLTDVLPEHVTGNERKSAKWLLPFAGVQRLEYPKRSFAPAQMIKLDATQPKFVGNLEGILGSYLLFESGVLPLHVLQRKRLRMHLVPAQPVAVDLFNLPQDN